MGNTASMKVRAMNYPDIVFEGRTGIIGFGEHYGVSYTGQRWVHMAKRRFRISDERKRRNPTTVNILTQTPLNDIRAFWGVYG